MTATQVPIIGWEQRYMTPLECKRLQSMDDLQYLPAQLTKAYEALGNAVNVRVAQEIAKALLPSRRDVAPLMGVVPAPGARSDRAGAHGSRQKASHGDLIRCTQRGDICKIADEADIADAVG